MLIERVDAKVTKDSRGQETIAVSVNGCTEASSPNGKSTGEYETPPYLKSLRFCTEFLNKFDTNMDFNKFEDLTKVEKKICKKLKLKNAREFGANALYALESAILKALAKETGKELYEIVGNGKKVPNLIGNVIGGGLHSSMIKKHPNFQEFVVIPTSDKIGKNLEIINFMYLNLKKELKTEKVNDEGALLVGVDDQEAFDVLNKNRMIAEKKFKIKIGIGIDAATSEIFKRGEYNYKTKSLSAELQYKFMEDFIKDYSLSYVEDPFEQHDFKSFAKLQKKVGKECLIVGDDLTATQYNRTVGAIRTKSINAMIIKPNQNGSLLELKKIFDLCKKHKIRTILSHRSGETMDDSLSDYAVGFGADYIKCGVATKWREAKLKRLIEIERKL